MSDRTEIKDDPKDDPKDDRKISSKTKRYHEYKKNTELREYHKSLRTILTTTRFNNATWKENKMYRDLHDLSKGCIYGTPEQLSAKIVEKDRPIIVLEMNNDSNKIMGIGLIRGQVHIKKHHIYSNEDYNRYAYIGKYRIDREDMSKEEDETMKVFDQLCFKGNRHQKRLKGIKSFPVDLLYQHSKTVDLVDFVSKTLKRHLEKI